MSDLFSFNISKRHNDDNMTPLGEKAFLKFCGSGENDAHQHFLLFP